MPTHVSKQYARRVAVCADTTVLYHTHAEDAARLVREGDAIAGPARPRIRQVTLACSLDGRRKGPCTPPSIRDYVGHPTVYRERLLEPDEDGRLVSVGIVLQLRHIPKRAWPVYRAAVVDCLPPASQTEIRTLFA